MFRFPPLLLCLTLLAVTGSAAPQRLVSTSPEVTELLFQLGKGADVVATAAGTLYPAAAAKLPVVGSLFLPSIERALTLNPSWILLDELNRNEDFERAARATGLKRFTLRTERVADLLPESRRLLSEIYRETDSPALAAAEHCLQSIRPSGRRGSFLALVWLDPPILAGSRTFLSDLLTVAGGSNLAPPSWKLPYLRVSVEWLIRHRPQALYLLTMQPEAHRAAEGAARRWWPGEPVETIVLPSEWFARANFTPLGHLEFLGAGGAKECRELAP